MDQIRAKQIISTLERVVSGRSNTCPSAADILDLVNALIPCAKSDPLRWARLKQQLEAKTIRVDTQLITELRVLYDLSYTQLPLTAAAKKTSGDPVASLGMMFAGLLTIIAGFFLLTHPISYSPHAAPQPLRQRLSDWLFTSFGTAPLTLIFICLGAYMIQRGFREWKSRR